MLWIISTSRIDWSQMTLDFKEIPRANTGTGDQDTFELFARDFLETIGYSIVREPGRGADRGRDLIVREDRKGVGGTSLIDWLVSCKHYAHSGQSVRPSDEQNISDRVGSHDCQGFMGFYSTIPSDSLVETLNRSKESNSSLIREYQFLDSKRIESILLERPIFLRLFARYFPNSFKRWIELSTIGVPVKLFNLFIEEKYSNLKDFFVAVYGSLEASIAPIKQSKSFEELMLDAGITCIYEEVLDRVPELLTKTPSIAAREFSSYQEGKAYSNLDIIWRLPQADFKNVTLNETPRVISSFFAPPRSHQGKELYEGTDRAKFNENSAFYYLYERYLVYSANAQQMFDSLFNALKDILD